MDSKQKQFSISELRVLSATRLRENLQFFLFSIFEHKKIREDAVCNCMLRETVWLRGNSHLFNGAEVKTEPPPLLPEWCEWEDKDANLCTPSMPRKGSH